MTVVVPSLLLTRQAGTRLGRGIATATGRVVMVMMSVAVMSRAKRWHVVLAHAVLHRWGMSRMAVRHTHS